MGRIRRYLGTAAAALACAVALTACGSGGDAGTAGPTGDAGTIAPTGDAGGDGQAQLINEGEIVVAMSGEFKPFSHFEDNQLTGFDRDIAAAIADELGLELKAEAASFASLIQGLQSGRYDALIASMSPTEERAQVVDFTDGYYTDGAQYFVANDSECESFDVDDSSLRVGVSNGTTYDSFLREQGFTGEVVSFESDVIALQDTEAGRLDGTVTGLLVGLHQINEGNRDVRPCGDPLYEEEPAIAVAKGNPLKDDINEALVTIKENGTYAEISNKWFGEDIS